MSKIWNDNPVMRGSSGAGRQIRHVMTTEKGTLEPEGDYLSVLVLTPETY